MVTFIGWRKKMKRREGRNKTTSLRHKVKFAGLGFLRKIKVGKLNVDRH